MLAGVVQIARRQQGHARIIILVLVAFMLGLGAGAFWLFRGDHGVAADVPTAEQTVTIGLSETTRSVLSSLNGPIEIRFYAVLEPGTPDSLVNYAGRVKQLVGEYQKASNGRIKVAPHESTANSDVKAAQADGMKAFVLDNGEASYLGVAVVGADGKESLSQLSPEWAQALEPDLTRAILRVIQARPAPVISAQQAQVAVDALQEVKRTIPEPASVSLAEGTRLLRDEALKDFKSVAQQSESQIKALQQKLSEARTGGSEADQQAAARQLQDLQSAESEKLKEIAARLQSRVAAWERLKSEKPGS